MNIEAQVISAVCKNNDVAELMRENVIDMFLSHKDVAQGLINHYYKYKVVPNVETLADDFDFFEPESTTAPTSYYIDKMRNDFLQTRLRKAMIHASQTLSGDSAVAALEELNSSISELSRYSTIIKDVNLTDLKAAEEHYDSIRQHRKDNDGEIGIRTGLKAIDQSVPAGFAPGNLIIMLGYSGKSKTWMSGYFAKQAFLQGKRPMIISMEMTAQAMRDRLYATIGDGKFTMADFQTGSIDADDFRTWSKKEIANKQDFIIVSPDGIAEVTPAVIQGKIDQYKPDIVVVDYIQLMSDGTNTRNETEKIRNISRELKRLAMRNNIPIIAISAVTSDTLTVPDSPPMLEQVAWSRSIQYDADLAIAVHKYDDTDIVEMVSRKNRSGPDFCVYLEVDLSKGQIRESFDNALLNG